MLLFDRSMRKKIPTEHPITEPSEGPLLNGPALRAARPATVCTYDH